MSIVAVAKKAGVSIATVSRVLNEIPVVNPKTAQAVRKAIAEMGYRPTRIRRNTGTAQARSTAPNLAGKQIAVMAIGGNQRWFAMPVMAQVLAGISRGAREHDLRLILEEYNPATAFEAQRFREMSGAIAFVQSHVDEKELLKVSRHLPVVWVMGSESHRSLVDHISADNTGVGYLAFEHLASQGCEQFAYVSDTPSWPLMRARGQAFTNAANDAGRNVANYLVTTDELLLSAYGAAAYAADSLEDAIELLRRQCTGQLGLFVPTDLLTTRIYPLLARHGLRPGVDLHIVSCDNEEVRLSSLHPRPKSIDLSAEDIGRAAVGQLISRFTTPDAPIVRVQVSPRL